MVNRLEEKKSLGKLFTTSFFCSLFIIGSGQLALPLYRKKMVEDYQWLSTEEMTDIMVIAQCSPGAIAVNLAVATGYRLAGLPGVLVMVLGTLLPPFFLMIIVQTVYDRFIENPYLLALFRGMNAAVAAVLVNIVISMIEELEIKEYFSYLIMIVTFILVYFVKVHVALVMLVGIVLGLLVGYRRMKR